MDGRRASAGRSEPSGTEPSPLGPALTGAERRGVGRRAGAGHYLTSEWTCSVEGVSPEPQPLWPEGCYPGTDRKRQTLSRPCTTRRALVRPWVRPGSASCSQWATWGRSLWFAYGDPLELSPTLRKQTHTHTQDPQGTAMLCANSPHRHGLRAPTSSSSRQLPHLQIQEPQDGVGTQPLEQQCGPCEGAGQSLSAASWNTSPDSWEGSPPRQPPISQGQAIGQEPVPCQV